MNNWLPIETAPQNGERIRAWYGDTEKHVRWLTGCPGWFDDRGKMQSGAPTHWQRIHGPSDEE